MIFYVFKLVNSKYKSQNTLIQEHIIIENMDVITLPLTIYAHIHLPCLIAFLSPDRGLTNEQVSLKPRICFVHLCPWKSPAVEVHTSYTFPTIFLVNMYT